MILHAIMEESTDVLYIIDNVSFIGPDVQTPKNITKTKISDIPDGELEIIKKFQIPIIGEKYVIVSSYLSLEIVVFMPPKSFDECFESILRTISLEIDTYEKSDEIVRQILKTTNIYIVGDNMTF